MAIQISRADIVSDYFLDYSEADKFLKLPVEPYLELLNITALPSQVAIINGTNSPKYRFVCAAISRRQGKTYIANIIGQLVSLVPSSNILIMSPNYALSQISFDLQRNLIKHFDLEVVRDNAKDKVIELSNGSTIRMGSVNQVDSCVGRSYDLIIFDEAALADGRDAFNVALRPTLDKDNPRMSETDIAEARKSMSEAEFRQEYEADFNTYEGQVWDFNYEECIGSYQDINLEGFDVFAGLDVGYRDPTAFCVVAYSWEEEKFFVLDEYFDSERTTEQHAAEIRRMIDKWDLDYIYIDSAAQQTRFDFAQNYDICTVNAKKSILDGIGHVAGVVDNNRLLVDQKCQEVLLSLDQYQWDPNPNLMKEKPKHNRASHMADALRYALYSFETSMTGF